MNKDYIFYINWEDRLKNEYRVGFLSKINEYYYITIGEKNNDAIKPAYKRGFIGLPGFESGKVYRSKELFEFFKTRVLDKNSKEPLDELSKTKGVSMVDSFYLEEVSDNLKDKFKEDLLKSYEIQEEITRLKENDNTVR